MARWPLVTSQEVAPIVMIGLHRHEHPAHRARGFVPHWSLRLSQLWSEAPRGLGHLVIYQGSLIQLRRAHARLHQAVELLHHRGSPGVGFHCQAMMLYCSMLMLGLPLLCLCAHGVCRLCCMARG